MYIIFATGQYYIVCYITICHSNQLQEVLFDGVFDDLLPALSEDQEKNLEFTKRQNYLGFKS